MHFALRWRWLNNGRQVDGDELMVVSCHHVVLVLLLRTSC
jgi:hypothetical protein